MVLGLILGPLLTAACTSPYDRKWQLHDFFKSPISACLLAVALFSIIQSTPAGLWLGRLLRAAFRRKRVGPTE